MGVSRGKENAISNNVTALVGPSTKSRDISTKSRDL